MINQFDRNANGQNSARGFAALSRHGKIRSHVTGQVLAAVCNMQTTAKRGASSDQHSTLCCRREVFSGTKQL
jgi:hypothetical protein